MEGAVEGAVGGGWFGYLGYQLGAAIERLPSPGRPPVPKPLFDLGFYDHVLRYVRDSDRWYFEALWTPRRARGLGRRLESFRTRLSQPARRRQRYEIGAFTAIPEPEDHAAAVSRCIDYILAGDIFQANLCLRLEARYFRGDPLDLFVDGAARLLPPYGGFIAGSA